MTADLQVLFQRYPAKVRELIDHTRQHGDPYWGASSVGIANREWITALLEYGGDDPAILSAAVDLDAAMSCGVGDREAYAKRQFLEALGRHASIPEAVDSQPWYDRAYFDSQRKNDSGFGAAWAEAKERAVDSLRLEAWRRAVEGVDEPVIFRGVLMYRVDPDSGEKVPLTVKKYSEGLLVALLKRYDPAFGDKVQIDQTTKIDGAMVDTSPQVLARMSDSEIETLRKLLDLQTPPDEDAE